MISLYPLRLEPLYRRYLWGGRKLATVLGRQLPPGDDFAESWEVVDRGPDQSRIAAGPLAGTTLGELLRRAPRQLLGERGADRARAQARQMGAPEASLSFPLLIKLLDAQRSLSVQVHPDDERAVRRTPPDLGKTEAWVVLDAVPGATVYAGLKPGCGPAELVAAVAQGKTAECLHCFQPAVGDCLFLPAGTVHALGAGLVVYEVQQSSDTTYRLYDWQRVGADGKPRALHIPEALEAINYQAGPVTPQVPQPGAVPDVERLVTCDKFRLDRWRTSRPLTLGGDDSCRVVTVVQGTVEVAGDGVAQPLVAGQTVLLPADLAPTQFCPLTPAQLLVAQDHGGG